jgi:NitT/TauT family transport system substrate-binding protein
MPVSALTRRRLLRSTTGLAAAALLGRAAHAQSAPIRIGVGSDPVFAAFFLASHEKLFDAEKVAVTVQTYTDGGEAMNALVAGQVDLSCASEPTSMIRLTRAELRPLSVAYQSGKYIKLVVGPKITDAKQIRKFGTIMGSTSEYCTRLAMASLELDETGIELVPSGPPELPALLARGDIDAFFAWEPWPSLGVQQGGRVLLSSADVGYVDTQWITVSATLLNSRPEECQAVLRALATAAAIVRDNPERAAAAVKAVTSIPVATSIKALSDMTAIIRDFTPTDMESYDRIAEFLAQKGITKSVVPYRDSMQIGFFKG